MDKAIYCMAATRAQAEGIINVLKETGFASTDISVLFPDKRTTRNYTNAQSAETPEGVRTGVGASGRGLRDVLGWLAGSGPFAIPGVGPFFAAGPILVALDGATGTLLGALIDLHMPAVEARRYEEQVHGGKILLSVHTENSWVRASAKQIFKTAGANHILSTGEVRA
jgi:hypothetical protein